MKNLLVIILLSLFFPGCSPGPSGKKQPVIQKGVLDLRDWDFVRDGPVELKGEWCFYWKEFIKETDDEFKGPYLTIPGVWNKYIYKGKKLGGEGYATLSVTLLMKEQGYLLAARIPWMYTAYSLFSGDTLLAKNGTVGKDRASSIPRMSPRLIIIPEKSDEINLYLHISNFHHMKGGCWGTIKLGHCHDMQQSRDYDRAIAFSMIGILIGLALYHLFIYFMRRKEVSFLILSILALDIAVRIFFIGEMPITQLFPNMGMELQLKIEYFAIYAGIGLYVTLIKYLFPRQVSQVIVGFLQLTCILFSLFLVFPARYYTHSLPYFYIFLVLSFLYSIFVALKALRDRELGSGVFVSGMFIFVIGFALDICHSLNWFYLFPTHIGPYTGMAFLLSQASVLSRRFAYAFATAERLTVELEDQVQERTEELNVERNRLKEKNETMEKELVLARHIQERLLPEKSPVPYIASYYKPMSEVGGDFFDFVTFPWSNNIGIFLSDVSGHGVHAAFITSMIKTAMLQAGDLLKDPAKLLTHLNEMLGFHTADNFLTVFYGIYGPDTSSILYGNAGHSRPYVVNKDGLYLLQEGKKISPPVALFKNEELREIGKEYENYSEPLPSGCRLLLYTDGLTEAKPSGSERFFEVNGLRELLVKESEKGCNEYIESIVKGLESYAGSDNFDDDVCIICVDVE